ncbi:MAG: aldehyde ferredoxin oxidoreductase family protein [Firmicutes bacterium]|nr:aldehyde ferredoxin oxidoreductase family protein [Bacillota bacterium]
MACGYAGKILYVDLSGMRHWAEPLDVGLSERFIGGSGLAAPLLFKEAPPGTEPLSPDNALIFLTGPFTGTMIPTSGRHCVVTRSPLTLTWGECDAGGHWGTALKRAGWDGIVVRGRAEYPVYLWVKDGHAEIRRADRVWGMDVYDADEALRTETSRDAVTGLIGPAGEKLVLLASIVFDGRDARVTARGGPGAVMGSKLLKGIVVSGTGPRPSAHHQKSLDQDLKARLPEIVRGGKALNEYGSANGVTGAEFSGDLPLMNWRKGSWPEGAAKLSGKAMAETILTGKFFCGACVIGCGRRVAVKTGRWAGVDGAGPEYESLGTLGSLCLVDDLEAVAKATELCNRLGLDTISTGSAVAFAMECYEKGLITKADAGLPLEWGSGEALVTLVEQMGNAVGLGAVLGRGVKRAAQEIGGLAPEYALHSKGLELPAHDPRAYYSSALSYATSNRGACHLAGLTHIFERATVMPEIGVESPMDRFTGEGKGRMVAAAQNVMGVMDSLKVCKFGLFAGITVTDMARWYTLLTGRETSPAALIAIGERIFNLKRVYNVRCGFSRKDDTMPDRILTLRRGEGGAARGLPPLGEHLADYYEARGWSEEGIPTRETLERLGLDGF